MQLFFFIIILFIFPPFFSFSDAIGIGPTFITYGFISYGAAVFIFLCVPETKSKTLEEINGLLSKG